MKKMKGLSALAAGSIAICLQLGTSMALAEEVCVEGDTVMGIKDLVVVTSQFDTINIDVDFRYTTGFDIYDSDLGNFPFNGFDAEEDAYEVMIAINNALGTKNPVPDYVGQSGQDVYFIGAEEETEGSVGLVAAVGSENPTGNFWDPCTQLNDCLLSAAVLKADEWFTYADLSKADGLSCGNAPPAPPPITPGHTGNWFDLLRSGEGFLIEIIGDTLAPQFLAYFFTYDDSGNQMWLSGVADINGNTAIVPMAVTSGTVFGAGFDPGDVITEEWGTITFTFSSCGAGTAEYVSTSFGCGTCNIERLSAMSGSTCP